MNINHTKYVQVDMIYCKTEYGSTLKAAETAEQVKCHPSTDLTRQRAWQVLTSTETSSK